MTCQTYYKQFFGQYNNYIPVLIASNTTKNKQIEHNIPKFKTIIN